MRERTLIRQYPEIEPYEMAVDLVKEEFSGLTDEAVLKSKHYKKKLSDAVKFAIRRAEKEEENLLWRSQLMIVELWCENRGLTFVKKGKCRDEYDEGLKRILVNSSNCPETQFYFALHECGHYLLARSRTYLRRYPLKDYDRFRDVLIDTDRIEEDKFLLKERKLGIKEKKRKGKKKRAKKLYLYPAEYCILRLQEEMEAWERGERLAERLGLILNDKRFARKKFSSLESYLDWAALERDP